MTKINDIEEKIDAMLTMITLLGYRIKNYSGFNIESNFGHSDEYLIYADKFYEIGFDSVDAQITLVYIAQAKYVDLEDYGLENVVSVENPTEDQIDEIIKKLLEKLT